MGRCRGLLVKGTTSGMDGGFLSSSGLRSSLLGGDIMVWSSSGTAVKSNDLSRFIPVWGKSRCFSRSMSWFCKLFSFLVYNSGKNIYIN